MEDHEKLRKRKREQPDANGQPKSEVRSAAGVKAPAMGGAVVPSEEEVGEFFAILQRMHMAVRYFDKKINVDGDRDGRFSGKLREALETGQIKSVATPTTSEGDHGNCHGQVDDPEASATEKNYMFDLNTEPDQEIV